MLASGKLKHRQQVLVRRFKAAKPSLSSNVKGHIEHVCVCKDWTATTEKNHLHAPLLDTCPT